MIKYLVDQSGPVNVSFGADGQLRNVKGKTPLDLVQGLMTSTVVG